MCSGFGAPIAARRVRGVSPTRAKTRSETATQNRNSASLYTTSARSPLVPDVEKTR